MITINVYFRVFEIKVGESTGTCFTIDHKDKQYVVTARHVIQDWKESMPIQILHEKQWKNANFSLIGCCEGDVDIAVMAAPMPSSPCYELLASPVGLVWGQDVYFLGFPYGWHTDIGKLNRDFPMPFVKKAIISCEMVDEHGAHCYFLDGHNNPGFSGGPVVFKAPGTQNFKVVSVISGYRYTNEPVYSGDEALPIEYRYNTGIIVSYGINHAVELIEKKPNGLLLQ
jgi:hypothetical protein